MTAVPITHQAMINARSPAYDKVCRYRAEDMMPLAPNHLTDLFGKDGEGVLCGAKMLWSLSLSLKITTPDRSEVETNIAA